MISRTHPPQKWWLEDFLLSELGLGMIFAMMLNCERVFHGKMSWLGDHRQRSQSFKWSKKHVMPVQWLIHTGTMTGMHVSMYVCIYVSMYLCIYLSIYVPNISRTCIFFLLTLSLSLFYSSVLLFSSTLLFSVFHLSILSEVWHVNFLWLYVFICLYRFLLLDCRIQFLH